MNFSLSKLKIFISIILGLTITAYPSFRTYWIPGPGPMFVFDTYNFLIWGFYGIILSLIIYIIYSIFEKK